MTQRTKRAWWTGACGFAVIAAAMVTVACDDDGGGATRVDGGGDAAVVRTDGAAGSASTDGGTAGDAAVATCTPIPGASATVNLVVQAPAGVTLSPLVRITGPMMAAPIWLMPGTPASVPVGPGYDIQYRRVKVAPAAGGLIGRAYTPSLVGAFDACIRAGEARTVTVAYTLEPGSERLWASAINAPTAQAAAFAPSSLSSGMQLPTVGQSYGATRVQDLAIDAFGNLWVADGAKLLMFGYGKLGASGQPAPDLTVTGAAVKAAQALAFDAVGNLWIANGGATPTLDLIRVTDLLTTAATVAPAPAVTIGSPALVDPKALAFDVDENLWIASAGNDSVLQLKAARLAASAPATAPDTTLTAAQLNPGTATVMRDHKAPWSLAFDKFGNLWVGFNGSSDIVRFTLADLSTVGAKRIDNPLAKKFTAASLKGLAFDETGGLWFSLKSGMGDFGRLPAADLAASGEAHPDVLITSNVLNTPERILLDPVPMGLPIRD